MCLLSEASKKRLRSWLLAEATPEEGEDSAAAFKRELKAHLEKQAEGVRVATLPDTGEQAGDQVCHSDRVAFTSDTPGSG